MVYSHSHFTIQRFFADAVLSAEETERVNKAFTRVVFKKGTYLFKEGSYVNKYFFLESGFVRSFGIDYKGNEVTTQFFLPKDIIIDWASFMMKTTTQENFVTSTDSICWEITYDKFQELFHEIRGFREAGRARLTQCYFKLKQHNLSMISDSAKERYVHFTQEYPEIIQNASLKHIATYLGITDTSLSRIRKELTQK